MLVSLSPVRYGFTLISQQRSARSTPNQYRTSPTGHSGINLEFFFKLLVWGMQHTKRVSRTIGINTIYIEWCRGMDYQKKLEAAWTNTLSEKDYPKANLGNVPYTF